MFLCRNYVRLADLRTAYTIKKAPAVFHKIAGAYVIDNTIFV